MLNTKPITKQITVSRSVDFGLAGLPALIIGRCADTDQFELLFVDGSKIMASPDQIKTIL